MSQTHTGLGALQVPDSDAAQQTFFIKTDCFVNMQWVYCYF